MWFAQEVRIQILNQVTYGNYWWWGDIHAHLRNEVHVEEGRVDLVQIFANNVLTMSTTEDTSFFYSASSLDAQSSTAISFNKDESNIQNIVYIKLLVLPTLPTLKV